MTVTGVYVALLFVLPGRLVVRPLGAVGTPALLLGMACAWWWVATRADPALHPTPGRNPVRTALLVHGWFMLAAYAVAHLRPLTALEVTGSDRAVMTLIGLSGVALVVTDGVVSHERLAVLVRRLVTGGAFTASIGLVQFATGSDPMRYLRVPGLHVNREIVGVSSRSMFNRPYGTALHPIEFGVVVGALLPLALHVALAAEPGRPRRRAWLMTAIIAAGVPTSLSRSAIVVLVVGSLTLATAWTWRRRLNAAAVAIAFTAVMWAAVPGLIGTIRSLFTGLGDDPSIVARTDRVPRIADLFFERPWLGRGLGTFSVEDYFLVDNEWYVSAIEVGIVGVTVIVATILTGVVAARWVARHAADDATRHLGAAVASSILALFAAIGTFDAFFYRIFTGLLFLLIGCAGALWRLERRRPVEVDA